jgi:hypothetical protein
MKDIVRSVPVRQRDYHQLVYAVSQEFSKLADSFVVGAIATGNGKRFLVNPGYITAFYPPISGNGAKDGYSHGMEYGFMSGRLGAAFGLTHVADNHPLAAGNSGVAGIQGIEPHALISGKKMEVYIESIEQGDKAFILIHSTAKVGAFQIVKPLPLAVNGFIVHKSIFGVFEDNALYGSDVRLVKGSHVLNPHEENPPWPRPGLDTLIERLIEYN